ncbi:MAG: hypothetical protein NC429_03300 [Lachnospiraceae bacterium]|nr:hypothetical protein [Lachnospiraceae bacterium]
MYEFQDVDEGKEYVYSRMINVEEEIVNRDGEECYIFFSSNGLYEENTLEHFAKVLIEGDRYEWKSIACSLKRKKSMGKIIYVRDVYAKFYIRGINSQISSIDKLVEYLRKLTKGYRVTTVGISSGGYMAAIIACKLRGERAFCISGQFDLTGRLSENEKKEFLNNNPSYYNIVHLIRENPSVPIYYFCPVNCSHDYENYMRVKDMVNVRCFLFPDKQHASTVYPFNFPDLLYMSNEKLERLCRHYAGKLIDKKEFLIRTMSISGWTEFLKRIFKSKLNINKLKSCWDVRR